MRTLIIGLALALAGCMTPKMPDGREATPADAGPPPDDAEAVIRSVLRSKLKDPYSAQVEMIGEPRAIVMKSGLLGPGGPGWVLCAAVNARNSFGAYTGFRTFMVFWREGKVLNTFGDMQGNLIDAGIANGACGVKG